MIYDLYFEDGISTVPSNNKLTLVKSVNIYDACMCNTSKYLIKDYGIGISIDEKHVYIDFDWVDDGKKSHYHTYKRMILQNRREEILEKLFE